MREMIEVHGAGVRALLAAHAVTVDEFRAYLGAVGKPIPHRLVHPESPHGPVTGVSQEDALAYCHWIGPQDGQSYRLPSTSELLELARESEQDGVTEEVWPHEHGHRAELRGGMKSMYFCEWTSDTDVIPAHLGVQERALGGVFYPPWLRHGSSAAQAHLSASEGYSFVTFRLARDT